MNLTFVAERTLKDDIIANSATMVDGIVKAVASVNKSTDGLVAATDLSQVILPMIQAKLQEHLQGPDAIPATAALYVLDLTGESIVLNVLGVLRGEERSASPDSYSRVIKWKQLSFWQRFCACLQVKI